MAIYSPSFFCAVTVFCRHPADPSSRYPSGRDAHRKPSNFLDTAEPSPRDVFPESRASPCSLTAKPGALQPRPPAALAPKPTRRFQNRRIVAGRCCNRCHRWDNKRSRLAPRLLAPPPRRRHSYPDALCISGTHAIGQRRQQHGTQHESNLVSNVSFREVLFAIHGMRVIRETRRRHGV